MVKATLNDQKTETRRVVKPIPPENARLEFVGDRLHAMDMSIDIPGPDDHRIYAPPYLPGDILYVRETWAEWSGGYVFKADPVSEYPHSFVDRWRPSIHMPKEAARLFLRVTAVRVERLQEITEVGARNEGAEMIQNARWLWSYRKGFETIWNSTLKHMDHVRYGWTANPWVWVISFERYEILAGWPDIE